MEFRFATADAQWAQSLCQSLLCVVNEVIIHSDDVKTHPNEP